VPPPAPERTPAPTPPEEIQAPFQAQIDQKAQRLADFFNGDVVELESPIGDPTPEINAVV